jgi:hypothetical protein
MHLNKVCVISRPVFKQYPRKIAGKSWLGKSEQGGKWSFCLTAAKMAG